MSEVTIKINEINSLAETIHEMQKDLKDISANIKTISNRLNSSSYGTIKSKLNTISTNVYNAADRSAKYADVLQESASIYVRAEVKAAGLGEEVADEIIENNDLDGYTSNAKRWIEENAESIIKALASGGPAFKYIKSIYDLCNGSDNSYKDIALAVLGGSKEALSVLDKVYKTEPEGVLAIFKELTGLTKYKIDGATASSTYLERLGLALKGELDKYKWQTGAKETGKSSAKWMGTVAKYIGVAVEVISEGFENYDEFKDSGNWGRMIGETAIESGVDIGLGILGVAAIGAAGAPAIVAGIAGAGVVILANKTCEWLTEKLGGEAKDIGEFVSDVVMDLGSWAVNTARDTAVAAYEGIKNTADAVGRGIHQISSTVAGWFRR